MGHNFLTTIQRSFIVPGDCVIDSTGFDKAGIMCFSVIGYHSSQCSLIHHNALSSFVSIKGATTLRHLLANLPMTHLVVYSRSHLGVSIMVVGAKVSRLHFLVQWWEIKHYCSMHRAKRTATKIQLILIKEHQDS